MPAASWRPKRRASTGAGPGWPRRWPEPRHAARETGSMHLSTYLLYLAAVLLLVLTPGPTMLMCMTRALHHGPRAALTGVAGSVTAVLCVMLLSALGMGALLASSET